MGFNRILSSTASYYSEKIRTHGASARGVDWNSPESQVLRFDQLLAICDMRAPFTINDYGCGYGALVERLRDMNARFQYCGFDISPDMIAKGRQLYQGQPEVMFVENESDVPPADYTVASGIFNVKQDAGDDDWHAYMLHILQRMDALSIRGFAFNVLTSYSDQDRMRPELYYADPMRLFDYCKRHFSRFVALLHDYPLYEFTLLVRK